MEDKRMDTDVLVNAPVTIMVGGASGKTGPKEVELRAPAMGPFKRQMKLVNEALYSIIRDNREFIAAVFAGKEVGELNFDLGSCSDSFEALVADLVGEDVEWINEEMEPQQFIMVLKTYMELVGYESIVSTLYQALQRMTKAKAAKQSENEPEQPPTPPFAEPSS